MVNNYTPTTEEVRSAALSDDWGSGLMPAEFDRWLAEVKAQAWEEGLMSIKPHLSVWPKEHHLPVNPYCQRKEQ